MDAIYGREGNVVAWLHESERIYSLVGAPLGWLDDDAVFSIRSGSHRGYLTSGHFYDNSGDVVGFLSESSGGPLKPVKSVKPLQPLRSLWPVKPLRSLRNLRAVRSSNWSKLPFEAYVLG